MIKRLDVRRLELEPEDGSCPFVLIVQADRVSDLRTVVVAPVYRGRGTSIVTDLELPILIDGELMTVILHELATFQRPSIGRLVLHADHLDWDVGKALDRLLFGV